MLLTQSIVLDNKMKHELYEEYKNIRIRPLCDEDLEFLRIWRNDSNNTKYLTHIPYITRDMQEKWFENSLIEPNEYIFAIDEIHELKKIVGSMSLYNITSKNAEFGKILIGDNAAHGKKIGLNSLKALLNICFNRLNLDFVYLHVYKDNKAAITIYQQAGFTIVDESNTIKGKEYIMNINKEQFFKYGGLCNET